MAAAADIASPASLSLKGARILVVEDEPFIAFDLMMAIEEAGATAIGPAATVAEALDFIINEPPDGAILDVNGRHGGSGSRCAFAQRRRGRPHGCRPAARSPRHAS